MSPRSRAIVSLVLLSGSTTACDDLSELPSGTTASDTRVVDSGPSQDGSVSDTGNWPGGGGGQATGTSVGSTDTTNWTDTSGTSTSSTSGATTGGSGGTATGGDGGSETGDDGCVPGQRRCDGDRILQCDATGATEIEVGTCGSDEYCDPQLAICKARVCTPNSPVCDDTVATLCNAKGDGFVPGGSDCAGLGLLCVDGMCRDTLCQAGDHSCVDGDVHRCHDDGLHTVLVDACTPNEFCRDGEPQCQAQVCVPHQAYCDDEVASTCNAEGSGPLSGGTDCRALQPPQSCSDGRCVPLACDPSSYFCQGQQLMVCDATGMSSTVQQVCAMDERCDADGRTCVQLACVPNSPMCDAQGLATTCNAQGSGTVPGGIDCPAMGKVCQNGACSMTQLLWGENFEDGDISDWPVRSGHVASTTELAAANGSKLGLRLETPVEIHASHEGARGYLPEPIEPSIMRFYARVNKHGRLANTIFWSDNGGMISFIFFHSSGYIYAPYLASSANPIYAYEPDEWLEFVFRFDWERDTVAIDINGENALPTQDMRIANSGGIASISLYSHDAGFADWDEFEFLP